MQDGGAPCGPDEVRTPGGRCIKKRFITGPEGIASVLGAATGVFAAIKNKITKRKEDKAEVAKMMKDIKSVSSKKKMQPGGITSGETKGKMPKSNEYKGSPEIDNKLGKSIIDNFRKEHGKWIQGSFMGYKKEKGGATKKYKTGGMVNSNSKVSALKSASTMGAKSGVNSKVSASKMAKGPGKRSAAPKKAKS